MGLSSFGPSFVDLKYILNTSMEKISLFSFFLSVGYLIGSLFGILYKYINRQLVIIALVSCMSGACISIPNSGNVWVLYVCAFLVGTSAGAWSNAKTVWLIEIWQKRNAPVMHLCSFLYGIGTIIGPLIDKQFVTGEPHRYLDTNATTASTTTATTGAQLAGVPEINVNSNDSDDRQSKLMIPFLIIGILQIVGAILMLLMYICRKYENRNHMISENQSNASNEIVVRKLFEKETHPCNTPASPYTPVLMMSEAAIDHEQREPVDEELVINNTVDHLEIKPMTACIDNGSTPYKSTTSPQTTITTYYTQNRQRVLLIGFVSALLAFQLSSEIIYMQFSATYFQYIPLKLSAQTSATLMSSMALTFTVGRGINIFVSMKLRPQQIIVVHLTITVLGLGVVHFGQSCLTMLWTGAMIMSYGLSPIICSIYCYLAQYMDVKNRIGTVLLFSAETLNMFIPFLMGLFIEKYPQIFTYIMFSNIALSSGVFVIILLIVFKTEKRKRQMTTNFLTTL
ncbi:uncharacterized protein LOC128959540 [Oppia nitens]|uniref:uncharacterized protein LOC128959540 n=1 Tax=Oppia nitens TaxID=1686743 RepID=UPI0023DC6C49|nr:uncharacterized protein LOC128959540 [Oppia nitens]